MPKTQINGYQIKDQSLSEADLLPQSIEGTSIKDGSITNIKVANDISASKIVISNLENKYVATNVESALNEAVAKIEVGDTTLANRITAEVNTLNTTIDTNLQTVDNNLVSLRSDVNNIINNEIATINDTIVANKLDSDNDITTLQNTINQTISSQISTLDTKVDTNKSELDNSIVIINSSISTINTTIATNKTATDTEIANLKAADVIVNNQITAINTTITDNKTAAENSIAALQTTIDNSVSTQLDELGTTKADLNGNLTVNFNAKTLTVTGDILPSTNSLQNIGSTTNRFKSIYVDEAHLSTNTLYLGDTPVLGTSADTILIKADIDQSINIRTTGVGQTLLISANGVEVSSSGLNADVKVQSTGTGGRVVMGAQNSVVVNAPYFNVVADSDFTGNTTVDSLTIQGNLTVQGTTTTVNSATIEVVDNIIMLNKGEVGAGVTKGQAGLTVDRGTAADYMILFDETDDMFKVGMTGDLETIASQDFVNAVMYVHPINHPASIITQDASNRFATDVEKAFWNAKASTSVVTTSVNGLMIAADKTKLDGISTGSNKATSSSTNGNIKIDNVETTVYTHPTNHLPSVITQDASNRFVTDAEKTTWNAKASTSVVTTSVNGLMIAADKTKLDGISTGSNKATSSSTNGNIKIDNVETTVYTHPVNHAPSIITEDSTHRFMTDVERTKLSNTKQAITGQGTFAGNYTSTTITFGTAMANTNYTVSVTAIAATDGKLGDVWIIKATTGFQVFNTGIYTGGFDYMVLY